MGKTHAKKQRSEDGDLSGPGSLGLTRHLALGVPLGCAGIAGCLGSMTGEARFAALAAMIVGLVAAFLAIVQWADEEASLAVQPVLMAVSGAAALPILGFLWFDPTIILSSGVTAAFMFGAYAGSVVIASPAMCPDPDARTRAGAAVAVVVQASLLLVTTWIGGMAAYATLAVGAFIALTGHLVLEALADENNKARLVISHVHERRPSPKK